MGVHVHVNTHNTYKAQKRSSRSRLPDAQRARRASRWYVGIGRSCAPHGGGRQFTDPVSVVVAVRFESSLNSRSPVSSNSPCTIPSPNVCTASRPQFRPITVLNIITFVTYYAKPSAVLTLIAYTTLTPVYRLWTTHNIHDSSLLFSPERSSTATSGSPRAPPRGDHRMTTSTCRIPSRHVADTSTCCCQVM